MTAMTESASPLAKASFAVSANSPRWLVEASLEKVNSNASRNVYLAMDPDRTIADAEDLDSRFPGLQRPPLFGIPIAIKDCFDVAGFQTSCGSRFYAEKNGVADKDSAVVARLRQSGALIIGKTHLHQLAYGITGENAEFGDCPQPDNPLALTGGSSSGSAASVQEGSAIAAIGTDTGGSIRVPAALCGLSGYRASVGLGSWQGAAHLAPSFDTLGWLFRDLRDGPRLAAALLGVPSVPVKPQVRIAAVTGSFLHDCEPAVLRVYHDWQQKLQLAGADLHSMEPDFWSDSMEIFAGIQAHEAAEIHRGYFHHFEPAIAERLAWGASLSTEIVNALRNRQAQFQSRMDLLVGEDGFLILPCAPISVLVAGADNSGARQTILRYTTPISLAGMPAVALPGNGGGVQLVAGRGRDAELLAFAAHLD